MKHITNVKLLYIFMHRKRVCVIIQLVYRVYRSIAPSCPSLDSNSPSRCSCCSAIACIYSYNFAKMFGVL